MPNPLKNSPRATVPPIRKPGGFTLVVTLSLMVLLTVIAVGLLGLSAISLRSSSQGIAQSEARANARLALMLAIGELQKQMGPDQRISAPGAIVAETAVDHPHWTGVWNSWKAGNEKSGGDATSEHSTIAGATNTGMAPTYEPQRKDHFRTWLLSLTPVEAASATSPLDVTLTGSSMPGKTSTAVELVGNGSLGATSALTDSVRARLLEVKPPNATKATGRYAWWVGDESQKARVMEDSYNSDPAATLAEKIFRSQAPGSTGTTTVKGLEKITDDAQLKSLASLKSLDLVNNVTGKPAENFHHVTPFSYQVLADVREGGLKRDLSTLLERPIDITENQDPFMLYRFDNAGQERVPIQDLAAYYQLYDSSRDPNGTKGIRYTSLPQNDLLSDAIQVAAPDYYANKDPNSFKREYTSLYRSPVPIKIQMVMAARAEEVTPSTVPKTYYVSLGLAPAVTLWNPNNVPLVMNYGDPSLYAQQLRLNTVPFMITWNKNNGSFTKPLSLAFAATDLFWQNAANKDIGKPGHGKSIIFDMYLSGENSSGEKYPITFQPGETRVMSYRYQAGNFSFSASGAGDEGYRPNQLADYGWTSEFLPMGVSAWPANVPNHVKNFRLIVNATDNLKFSITTEKENNTDYINTSASSGAALSFMMIQKAYLRQAPGLPGDRWSTPYNGYGLSSRTGAGNVMKDFNDNLTKKGLPSGSAAVGGDLSVSQMIANPGQWFTMLEFAMMAGSETREDFDGSMNGRKFASRPFLHSPAMALPFIDDVSEASLYNSGWNWWVQPINSVDLAEVGLAPNMRSGYFGGGNTSSAGSTHVIQREIPVVPPMSIAALGHAHLGGFSLATGNTNNTDPKVTAVGNRGLFPHTLQAIGNSYAHPLIAANLAYTPWTRTFNTATASASITLADHSYLANKALWDEFFFSSITPRPSAVKMFESSTPRSAEQVAKEFFRDENPLPLPNRRITPLKKLDDATVTQLFTELADYGNGINGQYGFADKIAAKLMVEGPFNVNSTSIQAWKTVFSSLKGKPVSYLDKDKAMTDGVKLDQATPADTPVGFSALPNGKPVTGSTPDTDSPEQWTSWRELTDTEITELSTAIVKQVKLRGPFLSLSEFINRRLDSGKEELSVKGALQAALDDPSVSINSGFRNNPAREFTGDEIPDSDLKFKKALKGPIAYGSAAYVDQADVLRNFSEQLTPRGDTFVIRTYGDSLDAGGNVVARAWCEAVVQRVPEYVDAADQPHVKQADLTSSANRSYGRKFQIVTFRWIGSLEV